MSRAASQAASGWLGEFILLAALWGTSFVFMRFGAAEFGALPTAGMRVALALALMWPLMLRQGHWPALRRHWRAIVLAGLSNSAIPFALLAWAVMHIATGLASILGATVPLFGALAAWIWLGERIDRLRWLGLALGFFGVALLAWRAPAGAGAMGGNAGWAIAASLLASGCYGLSASLAQRHLANVAPLATATGSQLGAAIGLALPTIWLWPAQTPGLRAWLAIAALAALGTASAYVLYFRLVARAGPSQALAATFITPVFAVFYGAVLLGERITPWMLGCTLVIVCGTMLSTGWRGVARWRRALP